MTSKLYYPWLDALKGLAILLMVMGHALAWSFSNNTFMFESPVNLPLNYVYGSVVVRFIYSFHMPLLFFVSGYLFFKPYELTFHGMLNILKKRTLRLLIPFFVTGVLVICFNGTFGYWFLKVLFELNVIFILSLYFINKFKFNVLGELIVLCLVYFILIVLNKAKGGDLINIFDISRVMSNYPAFILGILCNKYTVLERFIERKSVVCCAMLIYLFLFFLSYFCDIKFPSSVYVLHVLTCFSAIIFLFNFFKSVYCCDFFIWKILNNIGKKSLEIYMFHIFFLLSFTEVGTFILSINNFPTSMTFQLVYSLMVSSVGVLFSMLVGKLISFSDFLSKLFFGKF